MKHLAGKLSRYFVTAGVAAIVDIGGFALLDMTGMAVPASATISFCLAAVANYLLSSRFAFHQRLSTRRFGLFCLAATGGLLVNVLVTLMASRYVGVAPILAKVTGVGTAFVMNFWLNLRVVFQQSRTA